MGGTVGGVAFRPIGQVPVTPMTAKIPLDRIVALPEEVFTPAPARMTAVAIPIRAQIRPRDYSFERPPSPA